jgi:hypothetical protein
MTKFLPGPGLMRTFPSALFAAFRALRRQFWEVLASTAWDNASRVLHAIMFAAALAVLLFSPAAHARTYDVFTADVPFRFNVGDRTFRPGHYEFIFVGPGLVAVRDGQKEVIGSFVTRAITAKAPAPSSKLVFVNDKKHQQLSQIWLENHTEGVQILREELAVRSNPPKPAVIAPDAMLFLTGRQEGPRMKQ